jgi:ribose 5-phosphate isomerase B
MIIHLATDHAGFDYKQTVSAWLTSEGYQVIDHGAAVLDSEDDFPDYIAEAAAAVSKTPVTARAIIFGGSGQGEGIAANRYPQVRAAVYYGGDVTIPALSRKHNDTNILSIGARFVDINTVKLVIWDWLHTPPLIEKKYARRNQKIEAITKKIHT